MFWKILGAIVLVFVAITVITAIVKAVLPLLVLGLVVVGIVAVVKWLGASKKTSTAPTI